MAAHDICRLNLTSLLNDLRVDGRYIEAEVTDEVKFGRARHFWVKVVDSKRGSRGHLRQLDYEVAACCRYAARTAALRQHTGKFTGKEA